MRRIISLTDALNALSARTESERSTSHFFIIGAGVSAPTVKLSSAIEAECRSLVGGKPSGSGDPMTRYGDALYDAFPDAERRRVYLEEKVRVPISSGNMRLANILKSGSL